MPTLHTLLVGIDDYPHVQPLISCHRDVAAMSAFLRSHHRADLTLNERILLNDQATKASLSAALWSHLGQAKAGDVALFYFSGHGCREEADPVWKALDNDRALETLVCFDYGDPTSHGGLADKELRFLLQKVAANGAHVLTVFDCCHSGDATRGDLIPKRIVTAKARRLASAQGAKAIEVEPMRAWEEFLFSKSKPRALFETARTLDEVLPLPPHVHIAACRDVEEAYQTETGSLLTETLIDVVKRSGADLTYGQLQSRIANLTRGRYPQTPQIQVAGQTPQALEQPFLGGTVELNPETAELVWNEVHERWVLNRGAIHGLRKDDAIGIDILDEQGQLLTTGRLSKVQLDWSFVVPEKAAALKPSGSAGVPTRRGWFAVRLNGVYRQPVTFFLEGAPRGLAKLREAFESERAEFERLNIALTDTLLLADYCVAALVDADFREYYFITYPERRSELTTADLDKSLVMPLKWFSVEAPRVAEYLKHIARWQFVRRLANPASTLPVGWVDVALLAEEAGENVPVPFQETTDGTQTAELRTEPRGTGVGRKFRFRLTNRTQSQSLHVSLVCLSTTFEVQPRLIDTLSYELQPAGQPGDHVEAQRNSPLDAFFEKPEQLRLPTRPFSTARFLLIVATEPFDVSAFAQRSLWQDGNRGTKGVGFAEDTRSVSDDWRTQRYEVVMLPPEGA